MLRLARDVCRRLWLVSLLLLAAAHVAAAGALWVGPDVDGDGPDDRPEFDRPDPSAPRGRLSAAHVTIVVRGDRLRVALLAPRNLDDGASSPDSGASTQLALPPRSPQPSAPRRLATHLLSDRARPASACLCASFSPRPPPRTPELQFARV
jgi:hypothetical protein